MILTWWQILAIMGAGVVALGLGIIGAMASATLGGWLVYKSKTIMMPTPFLQAPKLKSRKPHTYTGGLFDTVEHENAILDETLSPAAARLREQKAGPADTKRSVMDVVTGKSKAA